jgi:hypothetical protein
MRALTLLLLGTSLAFAKKVPVDKLLEMAKSRPADLEQTLKDTLGADAIQKGTAVDGVDIPAYGPDSYPHPGVPEGKLTGPIMLESKIHPGMKANCWYYVPAQWDGVTPLPVQGLGGWRGVRQPHESQAHLRGV